jgi:hypothetical protein
MGLQTATRYLPVGELVGGLFVTDLLAGAGRIEPHERRSGDHLCLVLSLAREPQSRASFVIM